jgi:hypothetical protein
MKKLLLIGLIIELTIGGLLLLGVFSPPSHADSEDSTLTTLLPDIQKIYRTALTYPLEKAGEDIQDPEIADFYHRLIQKYGLDEP